MPERVQPRELAEVLVRLGCPRQKSVGMAAQLDKRARQLAEQKGRTYDQALEHLLGLMSQGWAAQAGAEEHLTERGDRAP